MPGKGHSPEQVLNMHRPRLPLQAARALGRQYVGERLQREL